MALTARWTDLHKVVPQQKALWNSTARFNVVPAGRRSGKTEIEGKRKVVLAALYGTPYDTPRFFCAAPTRDQAKRIYWDDLKKMIPPNALKGKPLDGELKIRLVNGAEIHVVGMDKPERIEGTPWDGGVLDEYGNMKPKAWDNHVRPALADRGGWCSFIGVPEGRNHYYQLAQMAKAEMREYGNKSEWAHFHWISAQVLDAAEIESAKRDLDELTYAQEFEASFVNFQGRAYYVYTEETHCARLRHNYNPRAPLAFCFDFNVDPGVACIAQEMKLPNGQVGTGWIGEVWIPNNSNTPAVCRKLVQDWGQHQGIVICYGDATGGARGTAQVDGNDWDLVRQALLPTFGSRLHFKVPAGNPLEQVRKNSVNSRFRAMDGTRRMFVDPKHCPHLHQDFEGVTLLVGGSGEIDKKKNPHLTHISDAAGYYVVYEYPVKKQAVARAVRPSYAKAG